MGATCNRTWCGELTHSVRALPRGRLALPALTMYDGPPRPGARGGRDQVLFFLAHQLVATAACHFLNDTTPHASMQSAHACPCAPQFSWDNVKSDKDREFYLGHSVKALAGRWHKNRDV